MNRNRKEKGGCFNYKNKNDKKKTHPSRCSCSDYRISMIASMVVSAFAEETQGQVQAKSYDLTFNKKQQACLDAASAMRELVSRERRMMRLYQRLTNMLMIV